MTRGRRAILAEDEGRLVAEHQNVVAEEEKEEEDDQLMEVLDRVASE